MNLVYAIAGAILLGYTFAVFAAMSQVEPLPVGIIAGVLGGIGSWLVAEQDPDHADQG